MNPIDRAITSVHELPLAHYRSLDPLKNLKLRVTLKRATRVGRLVADSAAHVGIAAVATAAPVVTDPAAGSADVPVVTDPATGSGAVAAAAAVATTGAASDEQRQQSGHPRSAAASAKADDDSDDYTFSWQEKLFSRREEDLYSDANRCILPNQVNYHNLLREVRERNCGKRPTHHLFTHVDHDNFTDTEEFQRGSTTVAEEKPTFLEERLMSVRRRHLEGHIDTTRPSRDSCGRIQPVATWKTDTRLAVAHTTPTRCQYMYIMADLTPNHLEPTPQDEYILCTLKVNANGVLSVQPDFTFSSLAEVQLQSESQHSKSYLLETRHQELFEFAVQHISMETDKETEKKERDLLKEVYRRRTDMLTSVVGDDFQQPPSVDSARVVLLGEIVSAEGFDASSLYIRYLINLPEGWYVTDKSCLSGTTQLGSTSFWDWSGVVTFALPLEIEFVYCDIARSEDQLIQWPEIFFEVCSIDYWSRQNVQGYTSMRIPDLPGMHVLCLSSWRPVTHTTKAMMQEFFVGGTPQLEDLLYTSVPKSSKESGKLSRYGFRTETTGRVHLRMNCIHQSCLIRERYKQQRIQKLAEDSRSSVTATSSTMMNVLEAFQQAKKKMQHARLGIR